MKKNFLFLVLVLSLLVSCIEVDLSAPGFPDMAKYFNVSDGMIQYTIAANFIGFCLSSLFYGLLSDSFGRRPLMLVGNAIMTVGALGCVFTNSIESLLIYRFIQGFGASASAVIVFAMIADVFAEDESVKRVSWMNSLLTIFLSVAPIAGSFIVDIWGWRQTFVSVAVLSVIVWIIMYFFLFETLKEKAPFSLAIITQDYKQIFKSSLFNHASFVPSALAGMWMAFVACGVFLYTQTYGLSITGYAIHQGIIIIVFSIVSVFISKILNRFGTKESIVLGVLFVTIGIMGLLLIAVFTPSSAIGTSVFMSVVAIGDAIIYPIIFAKSLSIFPQLKGMASSAIMGVRTLLISVITALMGSVFNDTLLSYVFVCLFILVFLCISVKKLWKLEYF